MMKCGTPTSDGGTCQRPVASVGAPCGVPHPPIAQTYDTRADDIGGGGLYENADDLLDEAGPEDRARLALECVDPSQPLNTQKAGWETGLVVDEAVIRQAGRHPSKWVRATAARHAGNFGALGWAAVDNDRCVRLAYINHPDCPPETRERIIDGDTQVRDLMQLTSNMPLTAA